MYFLYVYSYKIFIPKNPLTYKTNWNQQFPWGKEVGLYVSQENFCFFYSIWNFMEFAVMNDLDH